MQFNPGFRLSVIDALIIIIAITAALYLFKTYELIFFIIIFVTTHFFLFCNVIRMSRSFEFCWAFVFVILTAISIKTNLLPLYIAFSLSFALTVVLVLLEIKKPSYHGVFWRQLNPNLEVWFKQKQIN